MKPTTIRLEGIQEGGVPFSIPVTVLFSARKTLGLEVKPDGTVIARMPKAAGRRAAEEFVQKHQTWIVEKWFQAAARRQEKSGRRPRDYEVDPAKKEALWEAAREKLTQRTIFFAGQMGVTWNQIRIKETKTRWGSCSQAGNLNFNWKLILMPPEILDYVVVHELAHRREMNHSPRFWAEVAAVLPDYASRRKWLREHGQEV